MPSLRSRSRFTVRLAASLLAATACSNGGGQPDGGPRSASEPDAMRSADAKLETHDMLLEDLAAERHPSDGGGRARLAADSAVAATVSERLRFAIDYEVGALGIAEDGALALQPSPFWGWDEPQTELAEAPGYTEASTEAEGVTLEPSSGGGLAVFHVRGRALEPGERVRFLYGAGPAGARVDRYAEHRARIWISVDGDGDGVRAVVRDSPAIDVRAGRPAQILAMLPSTARPGTKVRAAVAVLDVLGNLVEGFDEPIELVAPEGLRADASVEPGATELEVVEPGVYRVRLRTASGLEGESNPLVARDGIPRILWADLHGHSQLSDGTGTPEDYYRYARDVAGLDAVALTDHDHWGMRSLDQSPDLWEEIREGARRHEVPGRFIALVGYEWTNWVHGHRHVLYFEGEGEVLSSLDPRYETPALLWEALSSIEGRPAISIAHHSAGGPVSTNWSFLPDPAIEPVTEIVSVHGSSEASDSPGRIYSPVEGNYVRDVLDRGARFGFIGSGDSHDGHPGLAHLGAPSGGLAAIFAEDLTRPAILEALRARRVYATNGPRIWLRMWLDDEPMGSIVTPAPEGGATQELRFAAAAVAPVERIDIIRSGVVVGRLPGEGLREQSATLEVPRLEPGEYVYVRIVQEDGGAAWSSPIYATGGAARE